MDKYIVTVQFKNKQTELFQGKEYAFWLTMPLPYFEKNPIILTDVKSENKDYCDDVQVTHVFKDYEIYKNYIYHYRPTEAPIAEGKIVYLTGFHIWTTPADGWDIVKYFDYRRIKKVSAILYGKNKIGLKVFLNSKFNSHGPFIKEFLNRELSQPYTFKEQELFQTVDELKSAFNETEVKATGGHENPVVFAENDWIMDDIPKISVGENKVITFKNAHNLDIATTKSCSSVLSIPIDKCMMTLDNEIIIQAPKTKKEDNKMDFSKMLNIDFGKLSATSELKPSIYGVAVLGTDKRYRAYDKINDRVIDVTGMTFDTDMLFKIPVAVSQVSVGDVIINAGNYVTVTAIHKDGTFTVIDPKASEQKIAIPAKNMFGFDFMTKVICPFDGFIQPSNDNPFGMNPMMMLALSDDSEDMSIILAMSMLSGESDSQNMLLPLLLSKKDSKIDPMVAMMLMGQTSVAPTAAIRALDQQPVPPEIDETLEMLRAPKNIINTDD